MGDLGFISFTLNIFGISVVNSESPNGYTARNSINETSITRKTCSILFSLFGNNRM